MRLCTSTGVFDSLASVALPVFLICRDEHSPIFSPCGNLAHRAAAVCNLHPAVMVPPSPAALGTVAVSHQPPAPAKLSYCKQNDLNSCPVFQPGGNLLNPFHAVGFSSCHRQRLLNVTLSIVALKLSSFVAQKFTDGCMLLQLNRVQRTTKCVYE